MAGQYPLPGQRHATSPPQHAHQRASLGRPEDCKQERRKTYRAGCSATGPPSLSGRYSSRRQATRATTAQSSATAATFLVTVTPIIAMENLLLPRPLLLPNT